ncbi:MAG: putative inorganic carbon transporter subunit DabA [Caldilineaceae bacterium]
MRAFAFADETSLTFETLPTVADIARQRTNQDWGHFVTESIRWAAAYFDQDRPTGSRRGVTSARTLPGAEAVLDRAPEIAGVRDFHRVKSLPESADTLIDSALQRLNIPAAGLDAYLHRLLLTVGGWPVMPATTCGKQNCGQTGYEIERATRRPPGLEVALLDAFEPEGVAVAWDGRKHALSFAEMGREAEAVLAGELLCSGHSRRPTSVASSSASLRTGPPRRLCVRAQAVFCIDMRSKSSSGAGNGGRRGGDHRFCRFLRLRYRVRALGEEQGGAQCPALLTPQFVINESVAGHRPREAQLVEQRTLRRKAIKAWRSFKFGAVSCFGFVGPVGLAYLKKLITDSLGKTRPVSLPAEFGLDDDVR